MTVNYEQYSKEKHEFFSKHNYDFKTDTSQMDEYNRYWKTYVFKDGAQWYEAMSPVYEEVEIVVHNCKCNVTVHLLRIEFWSTESSSKYYYEKW